MPFVISQYERVSLGIQPFQFEGFQIEKVRKLLRNDILECILDRTHLYDAGFDLINRLDRAWGHEIIIFSGISDPNPLFHTGFDEF